MFQSYALFPNMTVWDNIAFPLKIAKAEKKYIRQEVEKYLDMIQMSEHADKKPRELSGGQKQRVAIAPRPCEPPEGASAGRTSCRAGPETASENAGGT